MKGSQEPNGATMRQSGIIKFLERGPFAVRISREDSAWLVVARSHAWLHGSRREAQADAEWIARGYGVAVVEHA
jgi:hypothetical protein